MSKFASHTPGPWHLSRRASDSQVVAETGSGFRGTVADCLMNSLPRAEREANARLIAAAPELLEALKGMVFASELHGADSQQFFDARNQALAVIAKAEASKSDA